MSPEAMALIRYEARKALRRGAYFYLVLLATVLLAAASTILITVKLNERSERKLCAVVITSDDNYHRTPPVTDIGRSQAVNFSRLRQQLGCPPYKGA